MNIFKNKNILDDIVNCTSKEDGIKEPKKDEYNGCDAFYADHWLMDKGSALSTKEPEEDK